MRVCVCACVRCSFNGRLGILERHGGSQGLPDMYAIIQGMALWLQSQEPHHFKVSTSFLRPVCILECCWSVGVLYALLSVAKEHTLSSC